MVCLDTSFIADLNRKEKRALEKLKSFAKERMTTTVINIAISFGEMRIVTRNVDHFRRIPEIEVMSY